MQHYIVVLSREFDARVLTVLLSHCRPQVSKFGWHRAGPRKWFCFRTKSTACISRAGSCTKMSNRLAAFLEAKTLVCCNITVLRLNWFLNIQVTSKRVDGIQSCTLSSRDCTTWKKSNFPLESDDDYDYALTSQQQGRVRSSQPKTNLVLQLGRINHQYAVLQVMLPG